jgi:hypothetical protein
MPLDDSAFDVPLDGFTMRLRRSELEAVANGLGTFDSSEEGDLLTLAEAVRRLPVGDRAPTWQLAVRRYGHHKPLPQAAGEIGLDEVHAAALLEHFTHWLAEVPAPEHEGAVVGAVDRDPSAELEESGAARVMSAEMLGNAIAHGESVDLEQAHEASLRAAESLRE